MSSRQKNVGFPSLGADYDRYPCNRIITREEWLTILARYALKYVIVELRNIVADYLTIYSQEMVKISSRSISSSDHCLYVGLWQGKHPLSKTSHKFTVGSFDNMNSMIGLTSSDLTAVYAMVQGLPEHFVTTIDCNKERNNCTENNRNLSRYVLSSLSGTFRSHYLMVHNLYGSRVEHQQWFENIIVTISIDTANKTITINANEIASTIVFTNVPHITSLFPFVVRHNEFGEGPIIVQEEQF